MKKETSVNIKEMCVFAMLGALMFCSKVVMDALPNIHILAALTITYTLVYRVKALIPIYLFVFVLGAANGFALWWVPHLYLWTILWGVTMLFPKNIFSKAHAIAFSIIAFLHGLLYGTLYAPFQALAFHMDFQSTIAWIAQGFPFDIIHAFGNLAASFLIIPLVRLLNKLNFEIRNNGE